ncbi:MAG: dipeptide epimerase [Pseudomonadota bacterium]
MKLGIHLEDWQTTVPNVVSGYRWDVIKTLRVTLERGGVTGRGEGRGVYYLDETPESAASVLEHARPEIEAGITRDALRDLLPPSGARMALDCALWDLESRETGRTIADIAGLDRMQKRQTSVTIWGADVDTVASEARKIGPGRTIKLKLLGDGEDGARIRAVRAVHPTCLFLVDANQGLTRDSYNSLLPDLVEARVRMIEQPFPRGQDDWLDGLDRPVPVCADESLQGLSEYAAVRERYDMINIKLDKCGGLTEGLEIARTATRDGLDVMVGCMTCTSLAIAPALYIAQFTQLCDLDGPLYITKDRNPAVRYAADGSMTLPRGLWGWKPEDVTEDVTEDTA